MKKYEGCLSERDFLYEKRSYSINNNSTNIGCSYQYIFWLLLLLKRKKLNILNKYKSLIKKFIRIFLEMFFKIIII